MNLPTNRKRARLLIKTNYHDLLEACRDVMKREDLVPSRAYKSSRLQLPEVIRKLGPSAIRKNDNFINIYIRGFMDRFGVYAYPQDFEVPYKGFEYGYKELIQGLWYYDEGYSPKPDPEYDKWIEKFIEKNKKAR